MIDRICGRSCFFRLRTPGRRKIPSFRLLKGSARITGEDPVIRSSELPRTGSVTRRVAAAVQKFEVVFLHLREGETIGVLLIVLAVGIDDVQGGFDGKRRIDAHKFMHQRLAGAAGDLLQPCADGSVLRGCRRRLIQQRVGHQSAEQQPRDLRVGRSPADRYMPATSVQVLPTTSAVNLIGTIVGFMPIR